MSSSIFDSSMLGRQRCRQWTPLFSQQLRLRHLHQIMAFNLASEKEGRFYFTLHLTSMCAPFYTSEKIDNPNPRWAELVIKTLPSLSVSAFVLRVWQEQRDQLDDNILLTWGVNMSGLVYLGNSLPTIQASFFNSNTVIFNIRGGYFTSHVTLRTDLQKPLPFIDNLNIVSDEDTTKMYRLTKTPVLCNKVSSSYNVKKLQRLHSLQIAIKNKSMEGQIVRDKINSICGLVETERESPRALPPQAVQEESGVRYAPQLLTMNSLNKMLQGGSTKGHKQEVKRISKEIELSRFKTKLLSQEKDKKSVHLRHLKQKHNALVDENEERNSKLMENYHKLSKESEKTKEWKKVLVQHKEIFSHYSYQLHHRRRQLLQQLLFIYPIKQINQNKFIVHNVYLPNSDMLTDCSESGLATSLGYVAHILTMCSIFLQVPLRYPVIHYGSRSSVIDHISPQLLDKDRDFALYPKSRQDRDLFNYAVYLLNKNIAQLRLLCGLHTPDLKATLPNLLGLLQGKGYRSETDQIPGENVPALLKAPVDLRFPLSSNSVVMDPVLEPMRNEHHNEHCGSLVKRKPKIERSECGPGLSEILAIPEAFLNKEITTSCLKNYIAFEKHRKMVATTTNGGNYSSYERNDVSQLHVSEDQGKSGSSTDRNITEIEQGTDLLSPSADINSTESKTITIEQSEQNGTFSIVQTNKKQISRSVGSYTTDEECYSSRLGSDPVLSSQLPPSLEDGQEYLRKWLDSGATMVSSDENLCPIEEVPLPLTARTDALLNTKSFNLVKPKYP